ncbi:MAG TPA: GAP family protein, partial [Pilimelia sp.]|nr:GAP family protein [Pilimelia sp.]
ALLIALLGLALVDSLNPSVIGVTVYLVLAGDRYVARVLTYLSGVFVTYLGIGVLLLAGVTAVADEVAPVLDSGPVYAAQLAIGAGMLAYAILAPGRSKTAARWEPRSVRPAALFLLGVTVSILEFSTALPYLAAIAVLSRANLPLPLAVGLLAAYTAAMLLPPLLIIAGYARLRDRFGSHLGRWQERLRAGTRTAWLTIVGLVGFALVADALAYFRFFGLVELPPTGHG